MRPDIDDRVISLGDELPAIPERLLLAHARGEVLFICGAGVSKAAKLPDFRELVIEVYRVLDTGVHTVIASLPDGVCNKWEADCSSLTERQTAEVRRFIVGDYDVVLGMLERRLDNWTRGDSRVRSEVAACLYAGVRKPAAIHRAHAPWRSRWCGDDHHHQHGARAFPQIYAGFSHRSQMRAAPVEGP